jgi:hypothetical protein
MARLWNTGFELQSLTAGMEFDTVTTSASLSINTTTVNGGAASLKIAPSATTGYITTKIGSTSQANDLYLRFYIYITTYPASTVPIEQLYASSVGNHATGLSLTSTGTLTLAGGSNASTQQGSASSALSLNTWYYIEHHVGNTTANATANCDARINGTQFASGTCSMTGAGTSTDTIKIGPINGTTSPVFYLDDIAVNDSSGTHQNSYCGAGLLACLRPTGAGDSTQWTIGGSTPAATNWQGVDEIPPDDAVTLNESGNGGTTTDLFTINSLPANANGGTINVVTVGVRFADTGGGAPAFNVEIESQSGGTKASGSAISPGATTYNTNAPSVPKNYSLVSYTDPQAGGAWTYALVNGSQIGYTTSGGGTKFDEVTAIWAYVDYVPSAGGSTLTISVSDTTTTSETINPRIVDLVNTSDTTTTSESVTVRSDEDPNVHDTTVTSENITLLIPVLFISVSDTTTTIEALMLQDQEGIAVMDTTVTAESVTIAITPLYINVSDTTTTSENVTASADEDPNISDATTTSESVSLLIPTLFVSVSDATITSEATHAVTVYQVNVSDATTTSESISLLEGSPGSVNINVHDTISGSSNAKSANIIFLTDGRLAVRLAKNVYMPL